MPAIVETALGKTAMEEIAQEETAATPQFCYCPLMTYDSLGNWGKVALEKFIKVR